MNMPINLDVNLDVLNETPATHVYQVYRVALCWSSAFPDKKVLCLAVGAKDIVSTEQHKSFVRWVDDMKSVTEADLLV